MNGGAVAAWLRREWGLRVLLPLAAVLGVAFVLLEFPLGVLTGQAAFWSNPRGLIAHGWGDLSMSLSGALYFQQQGWGLPLFHIDGLGGPRGTSAIVTDSVPVVALLSRFAFELLGHPVNLFGAWTALCFVASAVAMAWLVALLGGRTLAAAAAAAIAALCMPALLYRWGHLALLAQFEIVLALGIYVVALRGRPGAAIAAGAIALAALALWTQAYMFMMVAGVLAAALGDCLRARAFARTRVLGVAAGGAALLAALFFVSGYGSLPAPPGAAGFGLFSMNLLSPVLPQFSGLVPVLSGLVVDGTGGQYEGFCYFGAGLLLLIALAAPVFWPRPRGHVCLLALGGAFLLVAVSNQVFLGPVEVLHIPLPHTVLAAAAVVRSSGRFIWPLMYGAAALAIAAASRRKHGAALLLCAMALQWIDTAPLRQDLARVVAAPALPPLNTELLSAAMARHDLVTVWPPFACLPGIDGQAKEIALQVQLQAAWRNMPTNTLYAARAAPNCANAAHPPAAAPGELRFYLPGSTDFAAAVPPGNACRALPGVKVCSFTPHPQDFWPVPGGDKT